MKGRTSLYFTYVLVISILLTGISLSRFSKSVTGGDFARVARVVFEYVPVSATLNGDPVSVEGGIDVSDAQPGDVLVYVFELRNYDGTYTNQVLLKYNISVKFDPAPGNLPLTYTVTPASTLYPPVGDGWTYMGFDGQTTHSYTLTVNWDDTDVDPIYLDKQQTIQIEVSAEQVDSLS